MRIGHPDAWQELQSGELENLFIEIGSHAALSTANPAIVVGRKGAGKSALLELLKRRSASPPILIDFSKLPSVYQQAMLRLVGEGGAERPQKYAALWRLIVLSEVMLNFVTAEGSMIHRRTAATMYAHLIATGRLNPSMMRRVGVSLAALTNAITRTDILAVVANTLDGVQGNTFDRAVEALDRHMSTSSLQFSVFIDNLDSGWTTSAPLADCITGLLNAVFSLGNVTMGHTTASDQTRAVTVCVAIPTDAWQCVSYRHVDRMLSHFVFIRWSIEELRRFLDRRIGVRVLGTASNESSGSAAKLLPQHLTVNGRTVDTIEYLLWQTMFRPRDLIVLTEYILRIEGASARGELQPSAIMAGLREYSGSLQAFVVAEFKEAIPLLGNVLRRLNSCPAVGPMDDFVTLLGSEAAPEIIVEQLYNAEIIGLAKDRPNKISEGMFAVGSPLPPLGPDLHVVIHPAFWLSLNVKNPDVELLPCDITEESQPRRPTSHRIDLAAERIASDEIASLFVESEAVRQVRSSTDCVLVGVRGSGRTSVLRTLTQSEGVNMMNGHLHYPAFNWHPKAPEHAEWEHHTWLSMAATLAGEAESGRVISRLFPSFGREPALATMFKFDVAGGDQRRPDVLRRTVLDAIRALVEQRRKAAGRAADIWLALDVSGLPTPAVAAAWSAMGHVRDAMRDFTKTKTLFVADPPALRDLRDVDKIISEVIVLRWTRAELMEVVRRRLELSGSSATSLEALLPPVMINELGTRELGIEFFLRRVRPLPRDVLSVIHDLNRHSASAKDITGKVVRRAIDDSALTRLEVIRAGSEGPFDLTVLQSKLLQRGPSSVTDLLQQGQSGIRASDLGVDAAQRLFDSGALGVADPRAGDVTFCTDEPFLRISPATMVDVHMSLWNVLGINRGFGLSR